MDKDNDVQPGTPIPAPLSSQKLSALECIHEVNKNKKKQLCRAQCRAPKMPAPAPNDVPSAPTPVELLDAELVPPPKLAAFAPADVAASPERPDTVYEHSSDAGGSLWLKMKKLWQLCWTDLRGTPNLLTVSRLNLLLVAHVTFAMLLLLL